MQVVFVTGLSGAGKSTCLHALEDLGFYCVDNVPVPLLPDLVAIVGKADRERRIAIGIDAREAEYLEGFPSVFQRLEEAGHDLTILFLQADDGVLVRRYAETRRKHPMGELPEAIAKERALLQPLRDAADDVIDSSRFTGRQLRQFVRDRHGSRGSLRIALVSFGYRNGLPAEADVVFDARFLANPWDVPELRLLTGLHDPVARFVLEQPDAVEFVRRVQSLVVFMAPKALAEGRTYLTVAIGCTGGQHRSVALVEDLAARLREDDLLRASAGSLLVRHREIGRD